MDLNVTTRIEQLEKIIQKHEEEIEKLKAICQPKISPPATIRQIDPGKTDNFQILKDLLESANWPSAVDAALICNKNLEDEKLDRADGILDLVINANLEKLSFLDYGCGEGHVAFRALTQNPHKSFGYDIEESASWKEFAPALFSTNWEEVKKNGPYDVVLLYDVIDHVIDEPVDNLKRIRSVLAPNAKIFIRCHPWCSRHATHLYQQINKAYLHLVFSEEELDSLGYKGIPTKKIIHPINTYTDWFKIAGLKIIEKEKITKAPVEEFFIKYPIVRERIKANWKESYEAELREGKKFPWQLEMQFIDFVLKGMS